MLLPSEQKVGGEVDRLTHNAEPARYSTVDDAQGDWDTIL